MSKKNSFFGKRRILEIIGKSGVRIHFCGVGGVSMSSLFCLSSHFGLKVSGSDSSSGEYIDALCAVGADVCVGAPILKDDVGLVVYSLAIADDDGVILQAERKGIPCVSRAEYMGALMLCFKNKIGVSGSHGKSTSVAMLFSVFEAAGLSPTVLSGASLSRERAHFNIGSLDYLIYEGCEYKDSFLCFEPDLSLFLNLELDHVDYFPNLESISSSFLCAMKKCRRAVVNIDDENLVKIVEKLDTPPVTFGENSCADYKYERIGKGSGRFAFSLFSKGELLGEIELGVIGEFNVASAAGVSALALECGIPFEVCQRALSAFSGIGRRLEEIGDFFGRRVFYDYAHHPTEIEAGIRTLKELGNGELTVVFGAHTYSRTKGLWEGFVRTLSQADYLIITEIAAVREARIKGVDAHSLAKACGGTICKNERSLLEKIKHTRGDIVIMGAINMNMARNALLKFTKKA